MIGFAEELYVSDALSARTAEICQKLLDGQGVYGIRICCIDPESGKEEAIGSELLSQSYYRRKDITVTALIADREEAILYLATRAAESYKADHERSDTEDPLKETGEAADTEGSLKESGEAADMAEALHHTDGKIRD